MEVLTQDMMLCISIKRFLKKIKEVLEMEQGGAGYEHRRCCMSLISFSYVPYDS